MSTHPDVAAVRDLLGPLNPAPLVRVARDVGSHDRADALLARILDGTAAAGAVRDGRPAARAGQERPAPAEVHRSARPGGWRPSRRLALVAGALAASTAVATVGAVGLDVVTLPWNDTTPAAGAYAATPAPLAYTPVAGTAPEVLTEIAARTAALPDDVGTGRYARVEMQEWSLFTRVGGDDHTVTSTVMPQRSTTWLAADGSGRSVVRYDQPGVPWTTTDETTYARGERNNPWPTLSPDDATIAERLALGHPAANGPAERLVAVNDLLRDQPMRPAVRAAVLRYLADTPTLELAGTTTDRLGRPGVAFSLESDLGGLPARRTMIVDPVTGRVLSSEEMLTVTAGALNVPIPSVIGYTAYRSSAYTDDLER